VGTAAPVVVVDKRDLTDQVQEVHGGHGGVRSPVKRRDWQEGPSHGTESGLERNLLSSSMRNVSVPNLRQISCTPFGVGTLGFERPPPYRPKIRFVEHACGFPWSSPKCWGGSISGDQRSFLQVLHSKKVAVVMVPPSGAHGWSRSGFGAGRIGRGGGHTSHSGMSWHHQDW
jgi:hypothetical protein